ncbi:BrnT family toxin [Candidatus Microgenomates bacterium]|nr:BrnT family toxin [Candidatus Microgenomates bacterium]
MFEWDKGNIDKNLIKHNVTNREAEEVFKNRLSFIFIDEKHLTTEVRYMIWGETNSGRRLSAFFTIRNDKIRIISARDMHKKERRSYEEKIQKNT